ncbi:hypothetical protein, partial [Flavobacterium silvaticum]|uniref:hypothetical protein n=1 Tax=Flavobacterium silvaticum TaxID=1852020 RepID=UPI001B7D0E5A
HSAFWQKSNTRKLLPIMVFDFCGDRHGTQRLAAKRGCGLPEKVGSAERESTKKIDWFNYLEAAIATWVRLPAGCALGSLRKI